MTTKFVERDGRLTLEVVLIESVGSERALYEEILDLSRKNEKSPDEIRLIVERTPLYFPAEWLRLVLVLTRSTNSGVIVEWRCKVSQEVVERLNSLGIDNEFNLDEELT